jgi:hypothetical protein
MSERYDHRDAETRAQDATTEEETVSGPVMAGAHDLRDDAEQAMAEDDLDESAEGDQRTPRNSGDSSAGAKVMRRA